MAQTLDIHIDAGAGTLLQAGAARTGSLPILTRGDTYDVRLRLRQANDSGVYQDLDLTGASLRLGIGDVDQAPQEGEFFVGLSGVTSSAISYNSSAASFYTAISGIAGTACTVSVFGSGGSAWVVTSATANSAITFTSDSYTLFPTSKVIITKRRSPATNIKPQYLVQLLQGPAAYCDTFSAASTSGVVTMSLLQDGSATKNEIYVLTVGADAIGGSIAMFYGSSAGSTVQITPGNTLLANSLLTSLNSITALSGGISVDSDSSGTRYYISFVNNLALTNITTALTIDASAVQYAKFYNSTLTMGTSEVLSLFEGVDDSTVGTKIEIELTESGKKRTVYQGDAFIKKDMIVASTYSPIFYTV